MVMRRVGGVLDVQKKEKSGLFPAYLYAVSDSASRQL